MASEDIPGEEALPAERSGSSVLQKVPGYRPSKKWIAQVVEQSSQQRQIFIELINKCPFGIYLIDDNLTIVAMNERSQEGAFRNVRPVIGRAFEEAMRVLWPEDVAKEIVDHFRRTLETGEPFLSREFVRPRADTGEVEGYEWELHRTRLPEGGHGVICYYYDSTELREAQRALEESARRQQVLVDELSHRVKNTLAIVQSLAHQTFGREGISAEAQRAFNGRLQALSRAQDAITKTNWEAAPLADILTGALDGCGITGRVTLDGPVVWLTPPSAVTFAMALHELATNAIKYGALSNDDGRVIIEWTVDADLGGQLRFSWREDGGPPVFPPKRRGFGSNLLNRALAGELDGKVHLDYRPDGVVCTIYAPPGSLAPAPLQQI